VVLPSRVPPLGLIRPDDEALRLALSA